MFGRMNAVPLLDLCKVANGVGCCANGAVARLLEATDHATVEKWVQFPKALFVFLVVPGDPESGAFYVYDRRSKVWYWVDFDDDKFGGYSVADFDVLVRECRFFDLAERPELLAGQNYWIVQPGERPHLDGSRTSGGTVSG